MTKVGDVGQEILKKKYYQDGEETPEDLFQRVAKVVAIPDVIDYVAMNMRDAFGKAFYNSAICAWFFPYGELAKRVFERRGIECIEEYEELDALLHNSENNNSFEIFSPSDIWKKEAKKYYDAMADLDFMPATPTLLNAGKLGKRGMLASCFFLDIEDSMEGIFDRVKDVALISQLGGGVGLDISNLRPEGSIVKGTNGVSSGPISFLKVFNETGNQVEGGGARRAALLATMRIDHPDIVKFIKCKSQEGALSNFNMSVLVTEEFMKELLHEDEREGLWETNFGDTTYWISRKSDCPDEISPGVKAMVGPGGYYTVEDIWNLLVERGFANGEPGILFDDHIQKGDIFEGKYGKLLVNPCTEINLLSGESCVLGSINLSNLYVGDLYDVNPDQKKGTYYDHHIDKGRLEFLVRLGVRFLDNTTDLMAFPLKEIEKVSLRGRKIGLGSMGLHDLMLKLKIEYGSKGSLGLIDDLYSKMKEWAIDESKKLGKSRGIPKALKEISSEQRNSGILTVAPTGSISLFCGCSSGIEPNFQWSYTRKDSFGEHEMRHFILEENETIPKFATTALEISPRDHVKVQAQVQKYICSGISKTCNLPNDATKENVDEIYKLAYKLGCKSVTVYRSGSRKEEVLNVKKDEDGEEVVKEIVEDVELPGEKSKRRERPFVLFGCTYVQNTPGGKAYVTINEDEEGTRECFISVSKAGSEIGSHVASTGRLISNSLQYRVPVESIINHLKGQKSSPVWSDGQLINSVPDAVGKLLEHFVEHYEGFSEFLDKNLQNTDENKKFVVQSDVKAGDTYGDLCLECGELLIVEGKCAVCKSCGYTTCGG